MNLCCLALLTLLVLPGEILLAQATSLAAGQADSSTSHTSPDPGKHLEQLGGAPGSQIETMPGPEAGQGVPVALTLTDAIARAQQNSPRLHEAAAATQRATAAARTARAYTHPSVEIFEGEQYAKPVSIPGLPGLLQHYAAYQTIEIPSERRARQQAATFAIASSKSGAQALTLSVVSQVKHAFYNALRQRAQSLLPPALSRSSVCGT